jgi:putative SOS response-associated peptidase YedK
MCGRTAAAQVRANHQRAGARVRAYVVTGSSQRPAHYVAASRARRWVDGDRYRPSYNVAPTRFQPVLVRAADGERELRSMVGPTVAPRLPVLHPPRWLTCIGPQHWGLIPSWAKADASGRRPAVRAINARDDTLRAGRSLFAAAAQRRRCVVLADGCAPAVAAPPPRHWQAHSLVRNAASLSGSRTARRGGPTTCTTRTPPARSCWPACTRCGAPAAVPSHAFPTRPQAGWWPPDNADGRPAAAEAEPLYSYAIVTTTHSAQLAFLHDRMPVLLTTDADVDRWLDCAHHPLADVAALLRPHEASPLAVDAVAPLVNRVGYDAPDCIAPAPPPPPSPPKAPPSSPRRGRKRPPSPDQAGTRPITAFFSPGPQQRRPRRAPNSDALPTLDVDVDVDEGGADDDDVRAWLARRHTLGTSHAAALTV